MTYKTPKKPIKEILVPHLIYTGISATIAGIISYIFSSPKVFVWYTDVFVFWAIAHAGIIASIKGILFVSRNRIISYIAFLSNHKSLYDHRVFQVSDKMFNKDYVLRVPIRSKGRKMLIKAILPVEVDYMIALNERLIDQLREGKTKKALELCREIYREYKITRETIDYVVQNSPSEPIPEIVFEKYRFIIECLHNENKEFIFQTAESNQNVYQIANNILDKNLSTLITMEETVTAIISQMNGELKGITYGGYQL